MEKRVVYLAEADRREIIAIRKRLLRWFRKHGRDFPWRETSDPYRILIAEIMLRRTRADQVRPVYDRFIQRYPTFKSLNDSEENEVAELVNPLGLAWRSPAFKLVAEEISMKYDGKVPETREELIGLTGIGDYVAGAILSVAFEKREWMVDANIARSLVRYFGLNPRSEPRRDQKVISLAAEYSRSRVPRRANLALLDHASIVCRNSNPLCKKCPLRNSCAFIH